MTRPYRDITGDYLLQTAAWAGRAKSATSVSGQFDWRHNQLEYYIQHSLQIGDERAVHTVWESCVAARRLAGDTATCDDALSRRCQNRMR